MTKANLFFLIGPVLILCECFGSKEIPPQAKLTSNSMDTAKVYIRYIVKDVEQSVRFYTEMLDFTTLSQVNSGFAMIGRGNLVLLLNKTGAGGTGKPMPDGTIPQPGGWNRIQLRTANVQQLIRSLKLHHATFRNELVAGNGGKQILLEDPSGNLIELFEANY